MLNKLCVEAVKIQLLNTEDALSVAKYPASGYFIDVSNYERFAFLVAAGALDTATTVKVQQATAVNGTPKDITGATITIADTGDDKWYLIEVETNKLDINNDYRYVTLDVAGPTGNDYGAILFLGFNPGSMPVTQGTDKGSSVAIVG
ncbi:MAG TPA: hypothetical protein VFF78_03850 [Anaerolineaceae bacterium]|nr:hypothetical protein [Anaerolineaceae bacterium]